MKDYIDDHYSDYQKAYRAKQAYLRADDGNKTWTLRKLIKKYLLLKDFQYSFRYMDIYIENRYAGYEQYVKLKSDIKSLLGEIKRFDY